jgi:hypothetical protein
MILRRSPRSARWRQLVQTSPESPALPRAAVRVLAPIRRYLLDGVNDGCATELRATSEPVPAWPVFCVASPNWSTWREPPSPV